MCPPVYRNIQKGVGSMNISTKRRVTIGMEYGRSLAVVATGLVIFLAGCTIAVYMDNENDRDAELGTNTRLTVPVLMSAYGGTSGALAIEELSTDPDRISDMDPFDGRVALVRVILADQTEINVKVPDAGSYDDHSKDRETMQIEYVAVETSTGTVLPARMEVTLFGE